jgi:hypothetical protein
MSGEDYFSDSACISAHKIECQLCNVRHCRRDVECSYCKCQKIACQPCLDVHQVYYQCCPSRVDCVDNLLCSGLPYGRCSDPDCTSEFETFCPKHLMSSRKDRSNKNEWRCISCARRVTPYAIPDYISDTNTNNNFCLSCMSYGGPHCVMDCKKWSCVDCLESGAICCSCSEKYCSVCYVSRLPSDTNNRCGACAKCRDVVIAGLKAVSKAHTKTIVPNSVLGIILVYIGVYASGTARDASVLLSKRYAVLQDTTQMRKFFHDFARWKPSSIEKFNISAMELLTEHWVYPKPRLQRCAGIEVAKIGDENFLKSLNFGKEDAPGRNVVKWWFRIFEKVLDLMILSGLFNKYVKINTSSHIMKRPKKRTRS